MTRAILLTVLFLGLPAWAQAATYYLDEAGSDGNTGTSTGAPWLTWAHAFANSDCGDRLIVMNGMYTVARHGAPLLTKVCTASTVYTVVAQNERQAFINGDGNAPGFRVLNSAHVVLDGLRVKATDNSSGSNGQVVEIRDSQNVTVKRGLFTHNNRYKNAHVLAFEKSPYGLIEENELYSFHRHGIFINYSDFSVVRRNYCNSRHYADIPGGYPEGGTDNAGDSCVAIYPSSNTIVENNISEGAMNKAYTLQASALSTRNKYFGNIALDPEMGISLDVRGLGSATLMPQNTLLKDLLIINPSSAGIRSRGAKNTQCINCSVIGGTGTFVADNITGYGDGNDSFFATNSLALNGSSTGFKVVTSFIPTWLLNYTSSYANADDYNPNPDHPNITNEISKAKDPALGTCRAWIPASSPLKGAGLDGADIGANVLYRYKDGLLTNVPLWDPTTGEFPHGALVAGVNDVAGESLFDVHKRLNVGRNGCSFPANYGNGVTDADAPSAPQNVRMF